MLLCYTVAHKEQTMHVEAPKSNEVAEVKFEKRGAPAQLSGAPLSTSSSATPLGGQTTAQQPAVLKTNNILEKAEKKNTKKRVANSDANDTCGCSIF
jgi:hypothetical protein